jgi:hypothetical protein
MRDFVLNEWLTPILLISCAYIFSFFMTFAIVMPVQDAILPAFGNFASLLFLPHGVRVVSAWLYGWRSPIFLVPGSILSHSYLFGSAGFSVDYLMAAFFGVYCAAFSFWLFALCGMDLRLHKTHNVHWRDVMLTGVVASILNSVGRTFFLGNDLATAAALFIGDVTGMFASMFLLMVGFRFARRKAGRSGVE